MPNRVTGLRVTQANLHRIGIYVEVMAGPALLELGRQVRDDMKANVREDTGRLKDNIIVGEVEHHGHRTVVRIGPNTKGWYARFLEFGTRRMGAFPFIRPARDRIRPKVKPRMRDKLAKAVKP